MSVGRVFSSLSSIVAIVGISLIYDWGSTEWWGAWCLVLAWQLARSADYRGKA